MKILQLISALYKLINFIIIIIIIIIIISIIVVIITWKYLLSSYPLITDINCPKTKTLVITTTYQKNGEKPLGANENTKLNRPNGLKRGKTRATRSGLVFVLHLISKESDVRFVDHHREK